MGVTEKYRGPERAGSSGADADIVETENHGGFSGVTVDEAASIVLETS